MKHTKRPILVPSVEPGEVKCRAIVDGRRISMGGDGDIKSLMKAASIPYIIGLRTAIVAAD